MSLDNQSTGVVPARIDAVADFGRDFYPVGTLYEITIAFFDFAEFKISVVLKRDLVLAVGKVQTGLGGEVQFPFAAGRPVRQGKL